MTNRTSVVTQNTDLKSTAVIKTEYTKITPADAKEIIDNDQDCILLDVRTESEYEEKHIEGSILIPDYNIEKLAPTMLPDKDEKILVYCRSGRRSKLAAIKLIEMGYADVLDFGGIIDWPYDTVSG